MLKLAEEHGEPHATLFIGDHNKAFARDAKIDTIELPSYFTKLCFFKKYCFKKGWEDACNIRGEGTIVPRDNADEHPTESPRYSILSWRSIHHLWKDRCSHINTHPPPRDTCDVCFEYKILVQKNKASIFNDEHYSPDDYVDDDDDVANEEAILDSDRHFTQTRTQKVYANEQVRLAKKYYEESLHFNRSNYEITFDYAQKLQLPYFGGEQPGDTFYFSRLNFHVFGIVNHSPEHDQMNGHPCHKGEGKKGANNVTILVK